MTRLGDTTGHGLEDVGQGRPQSGRQTTGGNGSRYRGGGGAPLPGPPPRRRRAPEQVAVAPARQPGVVLEVRERVERGRHAVVIGLGALGEAGALERARPGPL